MGGDDVFSGDYSSSGDFSGDFSSSDDFSGDSAFSGDGWRSNGRWGRFSTAPCVRGFFGGFFTCAAAFISLVDQ